MGNSSSHVYFQQNAVKSELQNEFLQQQQYQQKNIPDYQNQMNAQQGKPDTNVGLINFGFLNDSEKHIIPYKLQFCQSCKAFINIHSKIADYQFYQELRQQMKKPIQQMSDADRQLYQIQNFIENLNQQESVWICEFCGEHNRLPAEFKDHPSYDDVIYQLDQENNQEEQKQQHHQESNQKIIQNEQSSLIFCLDNSGSMFEFIAKEKIVDGKTKKIAVSRKQCVSTALESQIQEMQKEFPDRKMGLVIFNTQVFVQNILKNEQTTLNGAILNNFQELINTGKQQAQLVMNQTIKENGQKLIEKYTKLPPTGSTALGPALLVSLGLALESKPGSIIVICTDGLANIGLGSLEENNNQIQAAQFYNQIAQIANEHGIAINVITIKGSECNAELLGKLAEETNGTITRVNPTEVEKDFSKILKDQILATQLNFEVHLHKALKFKEDGLSQIDASGTVLNKVVGNATINTNITFEYEAQSQEKLQALNLDLKGLEEIPFQVQFRYTTLEGLKILRVVTRKLKTTFERKVAEQNVNVEILQKRVIQQAANLAQKGEYSAAQQYHQEWVGYLDQNINKNDKDEQKQKQFKYNHEMFDKALNKKAKRMNKKIPKQQQRQQFNDNEDQNYSSDEDKDEAIMINLKQGKLI